MTGDIKQLTVHPVCELFPLMTGEELERLRQDIKQHGLLHPIVIHEDQVVDGRNRLLICKELGIAPVYVFWKHVYSGPESISRWIWSTNAERRHLTDDQRLMAHVKIVAWEKEQEAKRRKIEAGQQFHKGSPKVPTNSSEPLAKHAPDVRTQIVEETGESYARAQQALTVERHDPELSTQVVQGKVTLKNAATQVKAKKSKSKTRHKTNSKHQPKDRRVAGHNIVREQALERFLADVNQLPLNQLVTEQQVRQLVDTDMTSFRTRCSTLPWLSMETATGGWIFRIDLELRDVCELRRRNPRLSLPEIFAWVKAQPQFDRLSLMNAHEQLRCDIITKRKANHDERQKAGWNLHATDVATQHEILNFVENQLDKITQCLLDGKPSETMNSAMPN